MGAIKTDEIKEKYRKTIYYGMKGGSPTIFFFDKVVPNLKSEYFDAKAIPDSIFHPSQIEKKDTYMKIVNEDENVDNFGNKGHFEMDDKFRVAVVSYAEETDEEYRQ